MGTNKDGPVVTDNATWSSTPVWPRRRSAARSMPASTARRRAGEGLFCDLAAKVLVGVSDGMCVRTLQRKPEKAFADDRWPIRTSTTSKLPSAADLS